MTSALMMFGRGLILAVMWVSLVVPAQTQAYYTASYTTYGDFADLMTGDKARYPELVRISAPGAEEKPNYTGFFFYQCLQFDPTDRYVLGMRVHCQNRNVRPTDRAEIGVIDLQDGYKWTQIAETTAWNWQQGARLQWRPGSNEILWNDRSDDGSHYVCRVYDFKTGARRTLPRPIYTPSPDGTYLPAYEVTSLAPRDEVFPRPQVTYHRVDTLELIETEDRGINDGYELGIDDAPVKTEQQRATVP